MRRLSTDRNEYARVGFLLLASLAILFLLYKTVVEKVFLVLPILFVFLIGIIYNIIRLRKTVDFFVDYEDGKIVLKRSNKRTWHYEFAELTAVRYKEKYHRVTVRFSDGRSFSFFTRNVLKCPLLESFEDVNKDLKRLMEIAAFNSWSAK